MNDSGADPEKGIVGLLGPFFGAAIFNFHWDWPESWELSCKYPNCTKRTLFLENHVSTLTAQKEPSFLKIM
jgi:hypothetical protein